MALKDYHETFGLPRSTPPDDLKRAWRSVASR